MLGKNIEYRFVEIVFDVCERDQIRIEHTQVSILQVAMRLILNPQYIQFHIHIFKGKN